MLVRLSDLKKGNASSCAAPVSSRLRHGDTPAVRFAEAGPQSLRSLVLLFANHLLLRHPSWTPPADTGMALSVLPGDTTPREGGGSISYIPNQLPRLTDVELSLSKLAVIWRLRSAKESSRIALLRSPFTGFGTPSSAYRLTLFM